MLPSPRTYPQMPDVRKSADPSSSGSIRLELNNLSAAINELEHAAADLISAIAPVVNQYADSASDEKCGEGPSSGVSMTDELNVLRSQVNRIRDNLIDVRRRVEL